MSSYTGVLIGATVIPVWNENVGTLPQHFAASGLNSAVSLLELLGHDDSRALNLLGISASSYEVAEGVLLESKRHRINEPLRKGWSGAMVRAGGVLSGPVPLALRLAYAVSGNKSFAARRHGQALPVPCSRVSAGYRRDVRQQETIAFRWSCRKTRRSQEEQRSDRLEEAGIAIQIRIGHRRRKAVSLSLRLRASGDAGMVEILLGVLTTHLAFVTTNGAFDNNFRSGSRRSVHVGWGHTFKLRAQRPCCNTNRHCADI